MSTILIVMLIMAGVLLLVIELFLIPGIGLAGIAGCLAIAGGVYCSYCYISIMAGHIVLSASMLLSALAIYVFLKSRVLDKMALQENIDSKVDLIDGTNIKVGDTGITISRLAPMGKVRIAGAEAEAKSYDAFLDQSIGIEVVAIEGNTLIVKPLKENI